MPEPLVCAGCSLLCDDVAVADASFAPECPRGANWYAARAAGDGGSEATIADQPSDVESALGAAAELLRASRRPLVHGFAGATIEDARAAVALADRLGAIVAAGEPGDMWPGAQAFPLRGASTATLGEIRDRSELVIVWREDPQTTHPRLLERLALAGEAATGRLAVIDDRDTPTAALAGLRLNPPRERDGEMLAALHLLARGREDSSIDGGLLEQLEPLRRRLDAVTHAAFVYGPALAAGAGGQRRALALHELVRELSHARHVVTLSLAGAPGVRGADDVLAWQTGYPGTVDLGRGHPELVTCTGPLIEQERVDVALRVGDDPATTAGATCAAVIALSPQPVTQRPAVWIRTAAAGVGAGGTMHRLDGVPMALVPPRPSDAPSAGELLERLLEAISA
jgi:formylmethanofuran dehydrogenase subunit B